MGEEESTSRVVWIGARFRVSVVRPVVPYPFVKVRLNGEKNICDVIRDIFTRRNDCTYPVILGAPSRPMLRMEFVLCVRMKGKNDREQYLFGNWEKFSQCVLTVPTENY